MSIRGILSDKDGTILKFQELWLPVTEKVIRDFILINHLPVTADMELLIAQAMGMEKGNITTDAPLAYMTYEQIGAVVAEKLKQEQIGYEIRADLAGRQLSVLFETVLSAENMTCIPTCDLKTLFAELKEEKIIIGLATADNLAVTMYCLRQLGVESAFDFIGCDDGILRPKPEPDLLHTFCHKFNLKAQEVAVVGDTVNDMQFAKQCGAVAIGTLGGAADRKALEKLADHIVKTPAEIPYLLKEKISV